MNIEILPTMKVKSPSQQHTEWPNNSSTYKKYNNFTNKKQPLPL